MRAGMIGRWVGRAAVVVALGAGASLAWASAAGAVDAAGGTTAVTVTSDNTSGDLAQTDSGEWS